MSVIHGKAGLAPDAVPVDAMGSILAGVGFETWALAGRDVLAEAFRPVDQALLLRYGVLTEGSRDGMTDRGTAGAVVVAFPYDPGPVRQLPGFASVAAFAAHNRYGTMVRLLKLASHHLAARSGLPARTFRVVVNSMLPEKELAILSGLGFAGRSSLVITDNYGPACLLGALLLPPGFRVAEGDGCIPDAGKDAMQRRKTLLVPGSGCGSCTACVTACPTGAISARDGGVSVRRCLQFWTTEPGEVPPDIAVAWGSMLYGCSQCVIACPRSAGAYTPDADSPDAGSPLPGSPADRARTLIDAVESGPGASVPLASILDASDSDIKSLFRNTALGMTWIHPACLRRNAMMAAGHGDAFDLSGTGR